MTQQTVETYIQSLSLAQPRTPSAEIQHLQLFVGKWNTEGETHASADAPAVKISAVDTYEWMSGKFFLVHHVDGHMGEEELNVIEFIGYDPSSQTYSCHSFDNRGNSDLYQANLRDPIWTIEGKSSRFTGMFSTNGNTLTGKWERSIDGLDWLPWMDVKLTKV
jgi:Protein of unknown function (DUF1579)